MEIAATVAAIAEIFEKAIQTSEFVTLNILPAGSGREKEEQQLCMMLMG
jgi:hypothetical protein